MEPVQDNPLFAALAVASTLFFLLGMRSFLTILPNLASSIGRWKTDLEIEDSLQLSRSRDHVALILALPNCLLAYSYSLYSPDIIQGLAPGMRLLMVILAMLVQLPLRKFLEWQLEVHKGDSKTIQAANGTFRTFSIHLFFLLFIAGGAVTALFHDAELTRKTLLWLAGFAYCMHVIRRGRIFASVCNPFTTILYLCGLELLPTSALLLSAILL